MSLSYHDALDYLYGLINYERQRPDRYTPDVISLQRPRQLLAALGNPQTRYPVLHLTGTKGKGSVSAMCASVLQAAGLRVGLYSSPHLQDFRERFRINSELIEPDQLAALVAQVRPHADQIEGLTWFEVVTALGFLYFAEAGVDMAVVEVGLGGRLDATNVLPAPLTTTITSLSYDHTALLGDTLAQIAFEKAGILKPGVPVISAPQPPEALDVLRRVAAERAAPLTVVGTDTAYESLEADAFGQSLRAGAHRLWTPLLGQHQVINAAVAVATLEAARERLPRLPHALTPDAIRTGLRLVNWPGRLEVAHRSPYLVLDVAHNAASATFLADSLRTLFPHRQMILVFGAFTDKDVQGMFRALLPHTSHLIVMQAINARAFEADQLAQLARDQGYTGPLEALAAAQTALNRAHALAGPDDLICITGSLSVVGEVRDLLGLPPARAAYLDEARVQLLRHQEH